jgi:hypothetical protein
MGKKACTYILLMGKSEGKRYTERPRRRSVYNIVKCLTEGRR